MNKLIINNSQTAIQTAWREKILKRDFIVTLGKMLQPQQKSPLETEEQYLRSANIQWTGVDLSDIKTMWFSPQEKQDLLLLPGDLLVNEGGDIGRCAIWNGELSECYIQNAINRIRPRNGQSPKFLYYWLNSLKASGYLDAIVTRITIAHLTAEKLERVPWPDVPLYEQRIIANYLDRSCTDIDTAVAAKQKQIFILNALQQSALHSAFADITWPVERIKDIAIKIGSGITPDGGASGYLDEGVPLLRSQNIHFDGLRLDDVAFISEETHAGMSNSQLKPFDVLLNITGASIGRCTYVPENLGEANVNQHVCIIRSNHQVDHRFLAYFMSSPIGQGQVFSSFTGASRQGLSHKEVGLINIPLPDMDNQLATVEKLEKTLLQNRQVIECIEKQIVTLSEYRKSLIHECITGKRKVS